MNLDLQTSVGDAVFNSSGHTLMSGIAGSSVGSAGLFSTGLHQFALPLAVREGAYVSTSSLTLGLLLPSFSSSSSSTSLRLLLPSSSSRIAILMGRKQDLTVVTSGIFRHIPEAQFPHLSWAWVTVLSASLMSSQEMLLLLVAGPPLSHEGLGGRWETTSSPNSSWATWNLTLPSSPKQFLRIISHIPDKQLGTVVSAAVDTHRVRIFLFHCLKLCFICLFHWMGNAPHLTLSFPQSTQPSVEQVMCSRCHLSRKQ